MTTVTAIFDTPFAASHAVEELEISGFARDAIGLVMSESTRDHAFSMETGTKASEGGVAGAVIGGALGALAAGLTAVGAVVLPGVGILAAGPAAAALAGAGAGGTVGGLIGALLGWGVPEYEAKFYESKLKEGNILVAVEAENDDEVKRAKRTFEECKGTKIAA